MIRKRFVYTQEIIIDCESEADVPTCAEVAETFSVNGMNSTGKDWWVAGRSTVPTKVEEFAAGESPDEKIARLERELAEEQGKQKPEPIYLRIGQNYRDKDGKCPDCFGWGRPAGCQNCGLTAMGG